jgi:hypothetical protein
MTNRLSLSILLVLSGFITGSAGCGKTVNPYNCPGKNPDDNCTEPVICEDNNSCGAPTGVCDSNTMTCVQCTTAMASACTGTSPICGADDSCHGCTTHTDCTASNVCLPDGSCAQPDKVAYVSAAPGGTDNPMCSLATPCTRVAAALATGRPYVKFHGVIDEAVSVNGGRSVTFLADAGAQLTRSSGNGAILTVQDDRTSLSIYDLSISNAPNSASGIGCLIPAGAGAPTLSLTRASIMNNPGGGISITNGTFIIVGNVFFNNGGNTALVGGISIGTAANAANRLEFNSFALNASQDGISPAVQCVAGTFTAKNNIMSGNRTPTPGTNQTGGTCMHAYSIIQPGTIPPGTQNSGSDPLFADPARGDLHLQTASPARRAADPGSDLTGVAFHDIDGNVRATPADIGAYQFK